MGPPPRLLLVVALGLVPAGAIGADVTAGPPRDLAVTVYRAPGRSGGSMDLNDLYGFALVSETRDVSLPVGETRLRFEGVADGIEAATAIVTGLPSGVVEKNRDAKVLSPSALIAAALGQPVVLTRTNPRSGRSERILGTIRSDAEDGVLFESAEGLEGLRCSGLPETLSFTAATGLASSPTLSVRVRSPRPIRATVTLSYLAHDFDWSANYVAQVSPDGSEVSLGAWVTLANGNGIGFPDAHTQVVAGRLNRESGEIEPFDLGGPILARCWPRGSTSDSPGEIRLARATPLDEIVVTAARKSAMAVSMSPIAVQAQAVEEEQLGDLKLYRVPDRTTVASRQSKQVRLLDREQIPVQLIYVADLAANQDAPVAPAHSLLRTRNDAAHHLGLPLPSGQVAVFTTEGVETVLLRETGMRDLAVDEELEIPLSDSGDVQVEAVRERTLVLPGSRDEEIPEVPDVPSTPNRWVGDKMRVEITNAGASPIVFELRLQLPDGARIVRADHAVGARDGRPIFRLTVPAHDRTAVRYQTDQVVFR